MYDPDILYSPGEDPEGSGPGAPSDNFDPDQDPPIKDVSGLFNERGFYKSAGFNFNVEEIINDFSGNLIYNIPLYNYKLHEGLPFKLDVIYNGSVSHKIKVANPTILNTGIKNTYNMNMPEWMISLNGVCVQAFNYITKYFSKPATNESTLQDYYINMIIPGYHTTSELRVTTDRDTISLLMGDGSTITLENETNPWEEEHHYTGNYVGKGKENYVRAKVEFIESSSVAPYPYYRRRKITLMKGDGLEYIFEERKNQFSDFTANDSLRQKPLIPLLVEIVDRFGYRIILEYTEEFNNSQGRPFLNKIYASGLNSKKDLNFNFVYGVRSFNILHETDLNDDYYFVLDDEGTYYLNDGSDNKNRIGWVRKITNSLNQTFEIEYETNASDEYYQRKYLGVVNPFGAPITINFNKLKRIRKVKTFLGLRRNYNYKNQSETFMEINVAPLYIDPPNPPHLLSSFFVGYGRDSFYSNMIENRTEYYIEIETGITRNINKLDYSYSYEPHPPLSLTRILNRMPISKDDIVKTHKTCTSLDDSTINNSDTGITRNFDYTIYPLYDPNNHFAYAPDVDASTKLIVEQLSGSSGILKTTSCEFDIGEGHPLNGGFNGSFLIAKRTESFNSALRIWEWEYVFKDNDRNKFIIESREKDPLQSKTIKKFKDFLVLFNRILFNNAFSLSGAAQIPFTFYMFNCLEEEYVELISAPGIKNKRKKYYHIDTTTDLRGYIGQLIKEEKYENGNLNKVETNYVYCKNDRAGEDIFEDSGFFPFKEGNMKEISKPNGQVTKFYYHPISLDEVIIGGITDTDSDIPYLKFLVKYNTNQIVENCEKIWDHRFPIRTDNIKRISGNDTTLLTTYRSHALDGSPAYILEPHRFLTEIKYQRIHRVSRITMPGDFSMSAVGEEAIIIDNIYEVDTSLRSNMWGKINANTEQGYFADLFSNIGSDCAEFYSVYRYEPGGEFNRKIAAFIGFNFGNLGIPETIESADLTLFIRTFNQSLNGAPYLPKRVLIQGVTGFIDIHGGDCSGFAQQFSLSQQSIIRTITIATPNSYNENILDIKNIITAGLKGLLIVPHFEDMHENGYTFNSDISFIATSPPDQNWFENFSPAINITGTFNNQVIIKGATIGYNYDDVNNKVDIYGIRNSVTNDKSLVTYSFDIKGNIRKKEVLIGGTPQVPIYDNFLETFNFLNNTSSKVDGAGNVTKFSYDGLQRLIETQNADGSISSTGFSYQNSIAGYFGSTFTGFIEKQIHTDEIGNKFEKYFDALGNLRRETKFLSAAVPPQPEEEPLEQGPAGPEDSGEPLLTLTTDYLFDSLNRLIKVKTPSGKFIEYLYDGYGRQSQRTTVDSGITKFQYDSNDNLIISQDANQRAIASYIFTFRKYDTLNRLTVRGENSLDRGDISEINPDEDIDFQDVSNTDPYFDYLEVNIYDELDTAVADIFTPPSDYTPNNLNYNYFTAGRLVATAFRTRKTDPWSYKYYKYDERGRTMTMWTMLDGLAIKKQNYTYNSQDQIIYTDIVIDGSETKRFRNDYDTPGRLNDVMFYSSDIELDDANFYDKLVQYTYNSNSLISQLGLNGNKIKSNYTYNSRNWLESCSSLLGIFSYNIYNSPDGNIETLEFNGSYKNKFSYPNNNDLMFSFKYDKSDRLLLANCDSYANKGFDVDNTYDDDGNILTLKRHYSDSTVKDNFQYIYYTGTNKLKSVSQFYADFLYDQNGNIIKDDLNKNFEIKYNDKNLITSFKHNIYGIEGEVYTQAVFYYYDEAGNRVRRILLQSYMHNPVLPDQLEPLKDYPIYDEESFLDEASGNTTGISPHPWFLVSNEHYLRSIDGRELVIFENQVVSRYNIWGKDNEGYIDSLGHKFYYLKDHLGSIRVVLGETNNIVSAQDYDVWGYLLDGRSFESNIPRYKFTGKERDKESNYDYFGARYYQFRIGRWNSQDPLFEKHFDFSPYNYVLNNMLKFIDPNGKQDKILTGNKFIDEPIKKELQDLQSTTEGYYEKGTELGEKGFQESEKLAATSYVNFAIKQTVTGWLIITGVSVALPVSVAVGISVAVGAVMYPDDVGVGEDEKLKLEKQREEIELKNFVKDNPQPKKESGIVTPKDKKAIPY